MTEAPGRYWIVLNPDDQGAVVAKFDDIKTIPDDIDSYADFKVQKVSGASALTDKQVDWSGLTEAEKDRLREWYPEP